MEEIKSNPILKFNDNQLHIVRKNVGYEDVTKLKQDIVLLRKWIQKQSHFKVKDFDDDFLERLLIYGEGSLEKTKQSFDYLCFGTNLMPEYLQHFDVKNEFRAVLNVLNICVTPIPTADNYRVLIANFSGNDDSNFELIDMFRYFIVIGHYMMNNDYCHCFKMIIDLRNITIGTVTKIKPDVIHKAITILVEAMNQDAKKIHMISGSKFFDTVLTIFKQGISEKMSSCIVIHSNLESLHEYMPKNTLPKELAGDEKSMKELSDPGLSPGQVGCALMNATTTASQISQTLTERAEATFKEMCSSDHVLKLKLMENIAMHESPRLSCNVKEQIFSVPGSFKTLCID